MKKIENNLLKIYFIQFLMNFKTYMPMLLLFFLFNKLTYFEIFILQSFSSLITLVFEIPSGYVADRFGRKNSLLLASILFSIAAFIYYATNTFWIFIIAELCFGLAFAFLSGSDDALIYDSLKILNREDDVTRYYSKIGFIVRISFAISALTGGIISFYWNYNYTFGIAFLCFFCSIFFILSLEETSKTENNAKKFITTIFNQFTEIGKKGLLYLLLVNITLFLTLSILLFYIQPYLQNNNMPEYFIGLSFSIAIIISAIVTKFTSEMEDKFGFFKILLFSLLFISVISILLFLTRTSWIVMSYVSIVFSVQGINRILFLKRFNEKIENENRATFNSIINFCSSMAQIIVLPVIGKITDILSVYFVFGFSFVITILLMLSIFICRSKFIDA
jgi:MFS family permease